MSAMSTNGENLNAQNASASEETRSPGLEDVDLYGASTSGLANSTTSRDSLSNATILNTHANAQRPLEHLETVQVNEQAIDIPLVHSPSPMQHPSLVPPLPTPPEVSYNGLDSRRDAAAGNDSSSRKNTSTSQNSDLRQNSETRKSLRRNPDEGRTSLSSTSRKDSASRRDSDPLNHENIHTSVPQSRHFQERPPSAGSPLNPTYIREESGRRTSRRRSSRTVPTPPANPYSGMGLYTTPQMYASPLPIPLYGLPSPPVDNSRVYSSNIQPHSHLPPVNASMPPLVPSFYRPRSPFIPPDIPVQPSPGTRQSISSNIVAAVARTPEIKNLRSIADPSTLPDAGSFADNNPYRLRGKQERSTPDFHSPFYHDSVPRRSQSQTWGAPAPLTPQGLPPGCLPYAGPSTLPNIQDQEESYSSRRPSHSRFDSPSQSRVYPDYYLHNPLPQQQGSYYDYYQPNSGSYYSKVPLRGPITAADVVSAASNMPVPEKKRTQSFMEIEPNRYAGSAARRNTMSSIPDPKHTGSFAEHNPYRLPSRKTTLDEVPTTSLPPPHSMSPTPRRPSWAGSDSYRHSARRRSSSDSRQDDYYGRSPSRQSHRRYDWDSEKYQPSRSYRRSPSPGYSRRRRRRRNYSPFKYGTPVIPPVIPAIYPGMPYRTSLTSFDYVVPLDSRIHRYHLRKPPGFWSRFATFFKSPFDRGRPTSFHHPYPRGAAEEPVTLYFILTVIIGQVYFHLLLRLPSLYFSRVSRIFDEANLNLYEITEMVFETSEGADCKEKDQVALNMQVTEPVARKIKPQYERLKNSWEAFIDSLIREWETFNIVSVLLLSAILTILQISTAASDPVTRYAALFSLVCALISLLFGCMYIIRFGTMRKTYAAVEWAKSVLSSSQSVIWNVWVLLSMPAVWLTWSIILFIVSIMSFVWRTNPVDDSASTLILSSTGLLVIRIVLSIILALGLLNAILITYTFRLYGEALDKDWRMWIDEWQRAKAIEAPTTNLLTPGSIIAPPGGYYMPPYQIYGPPPSTPGPMFQPFPSSPPPSNIYPIYSSYTDHGSRRERSRKRRHRSATGYRGDTESDNYSSSSESSSPRRRSRRRSRSPRPRTRSSSRDPPSRSNLHSSYTPHLPSQGVSPTPRVPSRSPDVVDLKNPDTGPFIPPLQSDNDQDQDPQGHVRFRSPLESTRGSSDWGPAYDSSFEYSSPRVVGPSSSSASASAAGMTHESSNVQIQNSDALRRRRPAY